MNFTREPIIETVITPKIGCKLVVRNSKGVDKQEYIVDAVEVVSFGTALFFRSLERPKSFLVPVSDYEIMEHKEARMVLKAAVIEKSVKIGKRDNNNAKASKDKKNETKTEDQKVERKKDKKKGRKKRPEKEIKQAEKPKIEEVISEKPTKEEQVSPSIIRKLFPPPNKLIKENLTTFKAEGVFEDEIYPEEIVEQEEFIIEEEKPPFSNQKYSEDFHKNMSDPEVLEDHKIMQTALDETIEEENKAKNASEEKDK